VLKTRRYGNMKFIKIALQGLTDYGSSSSRPAISQKTKNRSKSNKVDTKDSDTGRCLSHRILNIKKGIMKR